MKKLLIFGNLLLFTLVMQAQTDYFLFIQSENNQTFYIQSEGKTLSSSAAGHLIIPGLRDSVYTLNIGFPKNQFPEQVFQVRINKKDAGYQLKNLGAEGWALFNLQTLQLLKAQQVESKKQTISYGDIKKTDVFSTLMAGLVNDSAVLYTFIAKADPPKESSKTGIPDTPASTAIVKRDEVTIAEASALKSDTPSIQTDVTAVQNQKQIDTSRLQPVRQTTQESIAGDSIFATSQTSKVPRTEELANPAAKTIAPKTDSLTNRDTVKSDLVAKPNLQRNDTSANKTVAELPPLPNSNVDNTPALEIIRDTQSSASTQAPKALIVWFSEKKTDRGIELVYFDMSEPDKTDTINLLIPSGEIIEVETNKDTNNSVMEAKKEEEGNRRGSKFFEKIFGKNNRREDIESKADKKSSRPKESSIKVTTVEEKKVAKPSGSISKKEDGSDGVGIPDDNARKTSEVKNDQGNFFERVFGKKSKSSRNDSMSNQGSASVKVTTLESESAKFSDSTGAKRNKKDDEGLAEVEKLKKAQEKEDKTSTERFFGKLFGKKNVNGKDSQQNKSDQNKPETSIKVTTVPDPAGTEGKEIAKVVPSNSDCRNFASDGDLDKLRVRMLAEKDTDGQVTEARKLFKAKCLTTKQVHSLSALFRTDEGKYRLFDAAYPYVSDTANFKDLVELLSEEYYINRFKAMVRL